MKTILFATDFTNAGTSALDWAKLITHQYSATLVLLHIQQVPVADTALPPMGGLGIDIINPELMVDLEAMDHDRLNKLAAQLQADGINCQTELRWGSVTDTIILAADELRADLIVVGRGHMDTFFERLIGTEASGVARKAHCPVLVVPSGEAAPARLHTILFTTSLEFDQPAEFGQVVDLARTFGADLSVLHVHAENQPSMTDTALMIAQLQQQYGTAPLPVETIQSRTVTGGIETYLETHHPDLLVMANRERDFLSGLLNPSLTGRMVDLTESPILIYHAHGDL